MELVFLSVCLSVSLSLSLSLRLKSNQLNPETLRSINSCCRWHSNKVAYTLLETQVQVNPHINVS